MNISENMFHIYCDGACFPNPGNSGSGLVIYNNNILEQCWYGIFEEVGTNNTAELNALLQSLIIAEDKAKKGLYVTIHTDSMYCVNVLNKWTPECEKNNWIKKTRGPIKNLNLIKQCLTLLENLFPLVSIKHVKGHAGIEGNELANRLATLAIHTCEGDFSQYGYRKEETVEDLLSFDFLPKQKQYKQRPYLNKRPTEKRAG